MPVGLGGAGVGGARAAAVRGRGRGDGKSRRDSDGGDVRDAMRRASAGRGVSRARCRGEGPGEGQWARSGFGGAMCCCLREPRTSRTGEPRTGGRTCWRSGTTPARGRTRSRGGRRRRCGGSAGVKRACTDGMPTAQVGNRTRGSACPACAGKVPMATSNFEVHCEETGRQGLLGECV